jgi:hypothetical protein
MQQILKYLKKALNICIFCYIHKEDDYKSHITLNVNFILMI